MRLPKAYRFEDDEVRVSKVGDKVILEPLDKPPFDVEAWYARLDALGGADFLPGGPPDDPPILEPLRKGPIDVEALWAKLDALGARDHFPECLPDDPPSRPDPRKFLDE